MAADDSVRTELAAQFNDAVSAHEDVMAECISICRLFALSPEDLKYKYEAFLMSRPSGLRNKLSVFTLDVARELRKEIQRESQAKSLQTSTPSDKVAGVRRKAGVADLGGFLDGLATPIRKSKPVVPGHLSNTGNNANLPSPTFVTPTRTPTASTASAYRAGAGPSRLAPPSVTPIGRTSNGSPSSPVSGSESPLPLTSAPAVPFGARQDPHTLLETLNGHLSAAPGMPGSRSRIKILADEDPKLWDYRYMFEKMSARSEALDEQIDDFGQLMRDEYKLADLGDPHLPSEEDIHTVGRILVPPTDTNKANLNNLFLQSSRMLGSGRVVSLRFAEPGRLKVRHGAPGVRGFGLYPGALVCVKGRNGGGDVFVVDEVLMPPVAELRASPVEDLIEAQQHDVRLGGQPASVFIAAGPYTLESDLLYEPLEALVQVAANERPDVVILLGPFVDSAHPLIQAGKLTVSPSELFREQITARIARISAASPGTNFVLIPSVRDLVSNHAAYPQARFEKDSLGLGKKVRVLPNPTTFYINEVAFSLGSPDVLMHLRREEVFQRAEEAAPDPTTPANPNPQGDIMANAVRHVLAQRHFYPLFPAPEAFSADVNLDVTHWARLRLSDFAPDVLILPSKLKHFSKIVDSTLAINPGHLSQPKAAGTFAKLSIHPHKGLQADGDVAMETVLHNVHARTRSEVWRI